jgi:hypothetical protein
MPDIIRLRDGICQRRQRRSARLLMIMFALVLLHALLPALGSAQTWHTELVDGGGSHDVGYYSSLAIDHEGNLHVAYFDSTEIALLYAFRGMREKQWSRMKVDKDGSFVTLTVDSAGRPYFVYNSPNLNGLHYAHWDGTKWDKEIIDPGRVNWNTSIQVDAQGHPRISYYLEYLPGGGPATLLKYAYFDGKTWYIQTLDRGRVRTGKMNSLALDGRGNPHIAYSYLFARGDLLYARWDGSRWRYGAADLQETENTILSYGNSIALDSLGHPHIAYLDSTKLAVKCASWNGNRWIPEIVDQLSNVDVFDHVSLQIDKKDRPHIAYYDAGALKYAVGGPTGWHKEIVNHEGNVGFRPSLYLDGQDEPYISYYDVSNHALHLAHRQSSVAAVAALNK